MARRGRPLEIKTPVKFSFNVPVGYLAVDDIVDGDVALYECKPDEDQALGSDPTGGKYYLHNGGKYYMHTAGEVMHIPNSLIPDLEVLGLPKGSLVKARAEVTLFIDGPGLASYAAKTQRAARKAARSAPKV